MNPSFSPVALLTDLGLGQYVAATTSLLAFSGFVLVHVMPFVPQPADTTHGFLVFLWKVANSVTGGYGNARPSSTVLSPATAAQVPPADPTPSTSV